MESKFIGAYMVKDGLFIGDQYAAQDLEFIVANKVARIVNCARRQVPNHWESIGIHYMSLPWQNKDKQVILDSNDKTFKTIFKFIEKGLENGESVLVHSVNCRSRSACVIVAYLIKKYHWGMFRAIDFLKTRKGGIEIRNSFLGQISSFECRNAKTVKGRSQEGDEEIVLENTLFNSKLKATTDYHIRNAEKQGETKVKWSEHSEEHNKIVKNHIENGFTLIHSCFKGSDKTYTQVPFTIPPKFFPKKQIKKTGSPIHKETKNRPSSESHTELHSNSEGKNFPIKKSPQKRVSSPPSFFSCSKLKSASKKPGMH